MSPTRNQTQAAAADLNERVDLAVSLTLQIEELAEQLKNEKAAITACLKGSGMERFATAAGNEALLVKSECFTWNVDMLKGVLKREDFEALCPRKADAENLRNLLNGLDGESRAALARCKKTRNSLSLHVRASPPIATGL